MMSLRTVPSMITRYTAGRKIVLIGAGVAIGVSTYLVALKIRRNQLATSAKAAAKAAATAAGAEDAKSVSMRSAGVKNGFPPKAGAISDESKQACEGCDCGLMEPGPIEGTMHAYERHVIICSGQEDWPKVIEEEDQSLAESIFNMCLGAGLIWTKKVAKEAAANGHTAPKNRVKVTACSEPSRGPVGTTDVIVYPEGLVYSLRPDNLSALERFVKCQLMNGQVASDLQPKPVPYQKMVLVCTHMSRDKRCGRAGPQVLEEMGKELEARGVSADTVALRGSSHFGGHRFAGVLIIYPQGDWYGLVTKKNAAAIIDKCVLGTEVVKSNWRGNMSNPGVKAEPAPKTGGGAADTSTASKPVPEPPVAPERKEVVRRDSIEGA